jgi:hypothetical protein
MGNSHKFYFFSLILIKRSHRVLVLVHSNGSKVELLTTSPDHRNGPRFRKKISFFFLEDREVDEMKAVNASVIHQY